MQLLINRFQKSGGMVSKHVVFCIDARVELTPEEAADVKKYGLGKEAIYNSQRAKEHFARLNENAASGTGMGALKSFANLAMFKLSLNITIDGLLKGQHIEAKDMEEVMDAEQALRAACVRMRQFLDTAATFNGKEETVDY